MKLSTLSFVFTCLLFMSSCIQDKVDVEVKYYTEEEFSTLQNLLNLPKNVDEYNFVISNGASPSFPSNNAFPSFLSNTKATLGRVLFYDKKLSRNNTVACASCHKQELAFSDDKAFSTGFDGRETRRNSLALAAVANFETSYNGDNSFVGNGLRIGFLWDERAQSIHELSEIAITDPVEMGISNMNDLAIKLGQEEYYRILFRKAYGDPQVSPTRITEALQEFINAFVSVDSKFDKGLKPVLDPIRNFNNFTPLENLGKALYLVHCGTCHSTDMTNPAMRIANNGLEMNYTDKGVGGVTRKADEMDMFKVPFLRNIALTAPYMHDGRFNTLEEVVEHYNSGIQMHPNLHPLLRHPLHSNQPKRLNLSSNEKAALVAFLRTLTDESLLAQTRFSNPFRN